VPRRLALIVAAMLLAWTAAACSSGSKTKAAEKRTARGETAAEHGVGEPGNEEPKVTPAAAPKPKRKAIYAELARVRDKGVSGDAVYALVASKEGTSVADVKLVEREGSLRRWKLPPSPKPPVAAVRAGRPWGATRLRSTTSCSQNAPRTGIAHLRWRAARPGGTQWIVVTNLLRGFEFGKYEAAGPLPPSRRTFDWRRVHGQSIHLWRVLTFRGGRWLGSPTARFTGPTCVAEFEP